jgi:signal transduction histidine kinase
VSTPSRLVVAPVLGDGRVVGVVELGSLDPVLDATRIVAVFEAVGEAIGVALRSAHYREQLVELLEETQRQSEELQVQQEELRVSNEELEEQSRVLEASQARLELQQSELEHSNVQLEEQAQELERQKSQLLDAQQALLEYAGRLESASRYKSDFLANMSHELRTPLNSALILSRLLAENRDGNLGAEQVKYAKAIHASNSDLLALINDVLDLAKIESGHVELHPGTVEMSVLLERLRATFEPMASEKGLELRISADPDVPAAIVTDSLRLAQILKNLMSNAVKFTERGHVHLHVSVLPGERLSFAVRDTGIGLSSEQLPLIFEAFRQADAGTSRRFGGTGLGLSISRELARLLQAIGHPVYMAAGSLLLGAALAYGMHLARFAQLTRESERFTLVIAVVLLGTTLADRLGLSVPMALLCGGMLLRSLSQRLHLFPEHFGTAGALLVIILFTLTGVALDPRHVLAGGMMSLGLLLIRGLAKYLGAYVSAGYGGLAPKKAAWLALALLPMSSLAVLQAHEVAGLYADFGDDIVAIVLGAVLIMELLGPVATQVALRRSGEATPGSGAKEA